MSKPIEAQQYLVESEGTDPPIFIGEYLANLDEWDNGQPFFNDDKLTPIEIALQSVETFDILGDMIDLHEHREHFLTQAELRTLESARAIWTKIEEAMK